MEYAMYEYLRNAYKHTNTPFYRPLTEDLIVHLIGRFGLDILKNTKLIEPAAYPGQYVLSCEI